MINLLLVDSSHCNATLLALQTGKDYLARLLCANISDVEDRNMTFQSTVFAVLLCQHPERKC